MDDILLNSLLTVRKRIKTKKKEKEPHFQLQFEERFLIEELRARGYKEPFELTSIKI